MPNIAAEVDGETNRHPLGVCVGITPFNFPSMVPMWMFPVAIVCGNTFVLKPSEKVPLSAIRMAELLTEAGLPDGVFNIVHGDKEIVDALITHPDVAAISFVGSTKIARYIYETGTAHGKRVQAAGGAKNHLIIMPDADVDLAVKALAASAYGCSGQRCMAGSVALTVGAVGDQLVDELCTYSQSLQVGPTDGNPDAQMGPVINLDAVNRIAGYLDVAAQEGATVALDGRRDFASDGFLIGPSVVDQVQPEMRLAKEEVFGPLLSVIRTEDLEQAIAVGQQCSVRQWRFDLYQQRLCGSRIQAAVQRGHDRHQRGCTCPDGLAPVYRLERIVLWRFAHAGHRRHPLLHAAEDDADEVVRVGQRFARRSGLGRQEVALGNALMDSAFAAVRCSIGYR